jgi:hypothetical protein
MTGMTMTTETILTVTDDSGYLALIDCAAYQGFVSDDWTFEDLTGHFASGMARRELLVWDCADWGDTYTVSVRQGFSAEQGFRTVTGSVNATRGKIHLLSYASLSSAAEDRDVDLPEDHEAKNVIVVTPGIYKLRIVQTYNPEKAATRAEGTPHFIIEIEPGTTDKWTAIAWAEDADDEEDA